MMSCRVDGVGRWASVSLTVLQAVVIEHLEVEMIAVGHVVKIRRSFVVHCILLTSC